MAIATPRKPKTQHRKRAAQHHKHTPHYLKTYWPYIPALGIAALGFVANALLSNSRPLYEATARIDWTTQPATRIEAMTGDTNGLALAVLILMSGGAFAILLFQHWYRIMRTINRGEAFVAKHPWFDIVLVLIVTAGVVLSRQVI